MIYVDAGNSFIKIATHAEDIIGEEAVAMHRQPGEQWMVHLRASHQDIQNVLEVLQTELFAEMPILACSVVPAVTEVLVNALGHRIKVISYRHLTEGALHYHTPNSLGMDRYLACFGAHALSGGKAVAVVDAGTATTIDLMTAKGAFEGGVIMPGIRLMEAGLREYAPALPQVNRELPSVWPPKSTTEALQWGITGSFLEAIKAHLDHFESYSPRVWVTGGDADVVAQIRDRQLQYHPNLVLEGLRNWALSSKK